MENIESITSNGQLSEKEKKALRNHAYYEANRDRLLACSKKYNDENREKRNSYNKARYESKREEIQKNQSVYRASHAEQKTKYNKTYYAENTERIKINQADYRSSHKDEIAIMGKIWRAHNPEKKREIGRRYYRNHPDKWKDYYQRRRAIKIQTKVENFSVAEVYERDGWVCQLCKKKVNRKLKHPHPLSASLDHIVPLSRGGSHTMNNVHLTHLICNLRAGVAGVKQTLLAEVV